MNAAASALKMPPVGQQGSSNSQSQQKSNSPDSSSSRNGSTGQPGKGMYDSPMNPSSNQQTGGVLGPPHAENMRAPGSGGVGGSMAAILPVAPYTREGTGGVLQEGEGAQGAPSWAGADPSEMIDGFGGGQGAQGGEQDWSGGYNGEDAPENTGGDGYYPYGATEDFNFDERGNGPEVDTNSYDANGNYDPNNYGGGDAPENNTSYGGYDNYGAQDTGGSDDWGGGDESFAQGGGVLPTTGGAVPKSASPSRGRQTDDISARLNAGEFVMPRDVVAHKGTHFFNNLIAKSRKLRTGMAGPPARPTMKPALRGKPSFRSGAM